MPYKPNYCCNCGEKIDRPDWNWFTSRMFCENCESDFKKEEWLPKGVAAGAAVLAVIFSLGVYLKSPDSGLPVSKDKNIAAVSEYRDKNRQIKLVSENRVNNLPPGDVRTAPDLSSQSSANQKADQPQNTFRNAPVNRERANLENESRNIAFYCGAQTKKGTACTRRVKGKDLRCWQHSGMPAMR